jgi:hypothetical protein
MWPLMTKGAEHLEAALAILERSPAAEAEPHKRGRRHHRAAE